MFAGRVLLRRGRVQRGHPDDYNGTWLRGGWAQFFAFMIPLGAAIGATVWYERKSQVK